MRRETLLAMSQKIAARARSIAARCKARKDKGGPPSSRRPPDEKLAKGQKKIDKGRYEEAIEIFTRIIESDPRTVDAYRGRSEAELLLGRYSDAYRDLYALLIASVQPENIDDLADTILAGYERRLADGPTDVPALTGGSFARWVFWQYADAIPLLDQLLAMDPKNVYAHLFRGSNRLFAEEDVAGGEADLDRAIQLAPKNAHVRHIVADAYTYPRPDPERAFREASLALQWGLDTPRVHAILASALLAREDVPGAARHHRKHIDLVTKKHVDTAPLGAGSTVTLDLAPGRTHRIPLQVTAGERVQIETGSPSPQIWDSILVVLGPDGTPVIGSDDHVDYFAGLDWSVPATGTYQMRVTSFEGINKGPLSVTRS